MIRRPPRSTLFPTRRSSDLRGCERRECAPVAGRCQGKKPRCCWSSERIRKGREDCAERRKLFCLGCGTFVASSGSGGGGGFQKRYSSISGIIANAGRAWSSVLCG